MNDSEHFVRAKQHEFVHIRSLIDPIEQERILSPTPTNTKSKDKKKRP
jgi:hypothetical protein